MWPPLSVLAFKVSLCPTKVVRLRWFGLEICNCIVRLEKVVFISFHPIQGGLKITWCLPSRLRAQASGTACWRHFLAFCASADSCRPTPTSRVTAAITFHLLPENSFKRPTRLHRLCFSSCCPQQLQREQNNKESKITNKKKFPPSCRRGSRCVMKVASPVASHQWEATLFSSACNYPPW